MNTHPQLQDLSGMTAAQNALHETANVKGALMFTMETIDQFLKLYDGEIKCMQAYEIQQRQKKCIEDFRSLRDSAIKMGYIERKN